MRDFNKLFIEYLKSKGIKDVNTLTDEEKELYITDFLLTPEMQDYIQIQISEQSGYSNWAWLSKLFKKKEGEEGEEGETKKPIFSQETKDKFKGVFDNVVGGLIGKLGNGLGFNPNKDAILNSVSPNMQTATTTDTTKNDDAKKKKTTYIIVGASLLVIAIGLITYFATKNN